MNEKLSDRSRVCSCDQEPVHTVGWCEALRRSTMKSNLLKMSRVVYSSKTDPRLKDVRKTGDRLSGSRDAG